MSKHEDPDNSVSSEGLAFEYVAGTLRGEERERFEQRMAQDPALEEDVLYWEAQLMAKHETTAVREPAPDTWSEIEKRIAPPSHSSEKSFLQNLLDAFRWQNAGLAFALVWAIGVTLWLGMERLNPNAPELPNSDYVAVLTGDDDKPLLTALTSSSGATLWLKWEKTIMEENTSAQLWALSRRDGQIRPLFVFEKDGLNQLALDEATLRLIRDSEYLLLTREEEGGSAIDEPSDILIAKGACVRLNNT